LPADKDGTPYITDKWAKCW